MNRTIEEALKLTKESVGSVFCPICGEELFAPMEKLSIFLFGKCSSELSETQSENLIELSKLL